MCKQYLEFVETEDGAVIRNMEYDCTTELTCSKGEIFLHVDDLHRHDHVTDFAQVVRDLNDGAEALVETVYGNLRLAVEGERYLTVRVDGRQIWAKLSCEPDLTTAIEQFVKEIELAKGRPTYKRRLSLVEAELEAPAGKRHEVQPQPQPQPEVEAEAEAEHEISMFELPEFGSFQLEATDNEHGFDVTVYLLLERASAFGKAVAHALLRDRPALEREVVRMLKSDYKVAPEDRIDYVVAISETGEELGQFKTVAHGRIIQKQCQAPTDLLEQSPLVTGDPFSRDCSFGYSQ
ncbi:MAG: hypothetical protein ACYCOU_07030 [Sulfobacillus sp.]